MLSCMKIQELCSFQPLFGTGGSPKHRGRVERLWACYGDMEVYGAGVRLCPEGQCCRNARKAFRAPGTDDNNGIAGATIEIVAHKNGVRAVRRGTDVGVDVQRGFAAQEREVFCGDCHHQTKFGGAKLRSGEALEDLCGRALEEGAYLGV